MGKPLPMHSAPRNGRPCRLFIAGQVVVGSYWSVARCKRVFGPGEYRPGWFSAADDTDRLETPDGWEPIEQAKVP